MGDSLFHLDDLLFTPHIVLLYNLQLLCEYFRNVEHGSSKSGTMLHEYTSAKQGIKQKGIFRALTFFLEVHL